MAEAAPPNNPLQLGQPQRGRNGLPLPPENPDRERLFQLSNEERQRALELKAAVESAEDLENLNDLQYVQFSLTFQGDLEETLDRVRGLQAFRHEYKINHNFEEGMALTARFTQEHPGCLLSVAYDDENENYGLIYDRSRVDHSVLENDEHWRVFLGMAYYLFNTLCADPLSMRQGIFFIAECQGTQRKRMGINVLQRCCYHFLHHMPCKFHSFKAFNSNTVTNLSFAMMKPWMREDIRDKISLGCQFAVNLSSLYLMPNTEIATQRTLRRISDFMTTRFQNETTFSLSD